MGVLSQVHGEFGEAADEDAAPLEVLGGLGQAQVGETAEEGEQGLLQLDAGQLGAEAEVRAE
ncbi:hypothetical protein EV644_106311 [Kribbella orskensis]|uniref:Uncharacterized protein n=1 Tax=Kribbella orskensis TaxID=2512216 RepID=A0ABY2BK72_9ACTN|nr:hypothetical protein EV642_105311 [Kribbella sp. VKM Ac-2500]TCO23003.1 hypothetical protein EV644_106311 [Kribbella orskensis]